jgi:hypothetical protein
MADLITLTEYKELLGLPAQTDPDDAQVTALLPAASRSIRKFTDRQFEVAGTPATRTFQYDGGNILDIDDATAITAVTSDLGYVNPSGLYTLSESEWTAMPYRETPDDDPYYYIVVATVRLPASPEMGFERNLDTLGYLPKLPTINITASWGWPVVPADVKLAAALTVQSLMKSSKQSSGGGGALTSEAIAGYARSWQPPDPNSLLAIPNRARDLLLPYQRVY